MIHPTVCKKSTVRLHDFGNPWAGLCATKLVPRVSTVLKGERHMSEDTVAVGAAAPARTASLKRGALGLSGAVIMSAALMGPAVSVYFNPQLVAAQAGAATPFV